ncbi:MAG: serine protease [Gemmatimonadetes bacterium]|nr:serine protease [Gemmatimonadota bacterium]
MPTWGQILAELNAEKQVSKGAAYDVVRRRYVARLHAHTGRSTILYAAKWTQGGDADPNLISITEEDVQGLMEVVHGLPSGDLDLIVHSPGGSAEAAEAVVRYLRSKFTHIRVIVPQAAMSAATMLACAADEILMGKHSSLGPVDPQMILSGRFGTQSVPAQAILDQFERAKRECRNPELLGAWVPMLGQYGPALLIQCENALALSENLVAEWLRTWMLKAKGKRRAADAARAVAKKLKDHRRFKSHARHISRDEAKAMGLRVGDLETDQTLQELVLSVFHATTHTFDATIAVKVIENHLSRAFIKMQRAVTIQVPAGLMPFPVPPQMPAQPEPPPVLPEPATTAPGA